MYSLTLYIYVLLKFSFKISEDGILLLTHEQVYYSNIISLIV